MPGARFSKLPVITGPVKAVLFSIKDGSFKILENYTVKLSAKETNPTHTHPTFLEILILKQTLC